MCNSMRTTVVFAGAVRSQQSKNFSGLHVKGKPVHGFDAFKFFFNGFDFKQRLIHLRILLMVTIFCRYAK